MRRVRIVGRYVAAALAMSAVAAPSGWAALPEFSGPFPKAFTSTGKQAVLETAAKAKVVCAGSTDTGEAMGPKAGTMIVKFTGCKARGAPCMNPGAAPGTIVTHVLISQLGYLNRAKREVGVDLTNGNLLAEFVCGSVRFLIKGSVIGRITPVDQKVKPPKGFLLTFVQSGGKQKFTKFQGGPKDVLESSFGGSFEEAGLSSMDVITFSAETEIHA
jgi:hypothetical protein